jgi:1-acyl-sn-glycerol-3-phosphate acyltransferase
MSKWLSYLWYEWWYAVALVALTLGFSFRAKGWRRIPRRGPVLIIANHQSFFDPIALTLACPRRLLFLARKSLFKPRWFAWLLSSLGGVPMDQEGVAKEGLKAILGHLQAGEAVVVFPEGTRTENGRLSPLKPGVQLLIKRTQATIVPMGIAGAFEALPYWHHIPTLSPLFLPAGKSTIAVWVGEPLDCHRLADLPREQLVAELTVELENVKDRAEGLRRKARGRT